MLPLRFAAAATVLATLATPTIAIAPAQAASFDCSKAATPFEHAICDTPELSRADDIMAKAFATATGGLTKASADQMRADQRTWLDFAQRACTEDAKPLAEGSYDQEAGQCLVTIFNARTTALEGSRMLGGHRFYIRSFYAALPDPNEVDNDESYWKVGTREVTYPLLDSDDELAQAFNAYVTTRVEAIAGQPADFDGTEDTEIKVTVKDVSASNRITLESTPFWYPHGAAHGQYAISYLNYYVAEEREVEASDIFSGDDWQKVLTDAAWAEIKAEHKEWLMVEDASSIADLVVDPARWDLSDDYGIVIQFNPYEITPYAYGAPTVRVSWEKLADIQAPSQEAVRFY